MYLSGWIHANCSCSCIRRDSLVLHLLDEVRLLVVDHVCLIHIVITLYLKVGVPLRFLVSITQNVAASATTAFVVRCNLTLLFLRILEKVEVYTNLQHI